MMRRFFLLVLAPLAAFAAGRTVLDGVYTDAQAARGEAVYAEKCARCHEGADVDGPPLTGTPFLDRWREDSLENLYTFVKTKMPQSAPGSLDAAAYADLVAVLLKHNDYPAGTKDLAAADMSAIDLVGHDGPKPLPANATVLVVGCMTAGANELWTLANAAKPLRTRTADETSPEELKASAQRALGTGTYRLGNLTPFQPGSLKGQKVQVKGVLGRQGNAERINVLKLDSVGDSCAP
jgi:mono/diheme cytochrome c family protein